MPKWFTSLSEKDLTTREEIYDTSELSANPRARNLLLPITYELMNDVREAVHNVADQKHSEAFDTDFDRALRVLGLKVKNPFKKRSLLETVIDHNGGIADSFIDKRVKLIEDGEDYDWRNMVEKTKSEQEVEELESPKNWWSSIYTRAEKALRILDASAYEMLTNSREGLSRLGHTENQQALVNLIKKLRAAQGAFTYMESRKEDVKKTQLARIMEDDTNRANLRRKRKLT